MANGNWDDLINEAESERFVGREQELELFRKEIGLARPRSLIFYITGQGGVGKSTLLGRYRTVAEAAGFLLADTDELQRDVPSVLGRFARQFSEQGIHLKRFNERYKLYRQKMDELENDPQAPQGLAALLGRTIVRASYVVGDTIPGLRRVLDYTPQESVELQASEWAEYVARKLTNKDEVALVRDPTPILTSLFFEDLNELAQKRRFLLCFENFEATRQELQTWLLRLREYKPSLNIALAIAGRDLPGAQWDALRKVTCVVRLDVFTVKEAEAFLDTYSITDIKRREEIIAYSNRLPVLMSWLAAPEGEATETAVPTHDIVERFLRWITDPALRRVALVGAIPRFFNLDVLTCLLSQEEQPVSDVQAMFEWLQTMPFVRQHEKGWRYHDVVRRMLLRYQRQTSPQSYQRLHTLLANFSDARRHAWQCSPEEQWTHEFWRTETLVWLYHLLAAEPQLHWAKIVEIFVIAIRKRRAFAREIIDTLDQNDLHEELTQAQKQLVQLVKEQLQAIEQGELKDGLEMFEALCQFSDLPPQAKGYLLAYRGECFRQQEQWEKALQDFQEALYYNPEDTWALAYQGETYRLRKRYPEALMALDQAIALDEKNDWAIASRGQVYQAMKRYEEALVDFDRAIALNENYSWAIAHRGVTYRLMEQYEKALGDFDQAIALNENNNWAIANRGETYRLMERYEEALVDFDRAVALDENYSWAIANRGLTYRLMERYEEALRDFDRAVALNENYSWAMANRGETYRLMKRYGEALVDFDRAIALDEKDDWLLYDRALLQHLIGRQDYFHRDISAAIAIAQSELERSVEQNDNFYRLRFNIALYLLADGSTEAAQAEYTQLLSECHIVARLRDAVEDLRELLGMQSTNELAQQMLDQLEEHVQGLMRTNKGQGANHSNKKA